MITPNTERMAPSKNANFAKILIAKSALKMQEQVRKRSKLKAREITLLIDISGALEYTAEIVAGNNTRKTEADPSKKSLSAANLSTVPAIKIRSNTKTGQTEDIGNPILSTGLK
jgi:ABC-type enterochelin transport system ATPase subunit